MKDWYTKLKELAGSCIGLMSSRDPLYGDIRGLDDVELSSIISIKSKRIKFLVRRRASGPLNEHQKKAMRDSIIDIINYALALGDKELEETEAGTE